MAEPDRAAPKPPRVWVDYNKWGVANGRGRVFLAPADTTELPLAQGAPLNDPQAHSTETIALREGITVRLVDLDDDLNNRPCTLEVDGVVHLEPGRHWLATYNQPDMVWIPREV